MARNSAERQHPRARAHRRQLPAPVAVMICLLAEEPVGSARGSGGGALGGVRSNRRGGDGHGNQYRSQCWRSRGRRSQLRGGTPLAQRAGALAG